MAEQPLGVYGLRIVGEDVAAARDAFVAVAPDSPVVGVEVLRASSTRDLEHVTSDELVLAFRGGIRYEIRRDPGAFRLHLPAEVSAHALVHPLLTIAASAHSRWAGRLALHGGAFVVDGRAFCVLAGKMGGKSSLLAGLAARGVPVLTDDLVVVSGTSVLPGPRTVDLRPEAAEVLRMGEDIGMVGARLRQRVALPPPPLTASLAGFVVLEWSDDGDDDVRTRSLSLDERLSALLSHDALPLMGRPPAAALFQAAASPMRVLRRPRAWHRFGETLDALLELVGRGAGERPSSTCSIAPGVSCS